MKVLLSHPTGNANVRAIAMGFLKAGLLETFYTTIACFDDSLWLKTGIKEFEKRRYDNALKKVTVTMPWRELGRTTASRLGINFLTARESDIFSVDSVYKTLDKNVAKQISLKKSEPIVYCYEDGAYYSFQAAKKFKLKCAYELPIAYWQTARELLLHEAERYPRWKNTLAGGITDSIEKLEKKTAELELADIVVVPSNFVAESLPTWSSDKKIITAPFGTPISPTVNNKEIRRESYNKPLRLLFVGSMSQRKGLADLFEAIKLLNTKHVELIVLGSLAEDISFYRRELPAFQYEPPRQHAEVLKFMETCDIFCLPSIVEGRALVMQEAMSRNLPLIITKNTGGEDLIKQDETGFIVQIGSASAIAEKIEWFLMNKKQIRSMGDAAAKHAVGYTWEKYSNSIINALE